MIGLSGPVCHRVAAKMQAHWMLFLRLVALAFVLGFTVIDYRTAVESPAGASAAPFVVMSVVCPIVARETRKQGDTGPVGRRILLWFANFMGIAMVLERAKVSDLELRSRSPPAATP